MTPASYVIYGIILTMLGAGICLFAGYLYYLAVQTQSLAAAMNELAHALQGLPQNLYGVAPALAKLAEGVVKHESQVAGLVAVIADANKNAPVDKAEPFDGNGKDANWTASIPQSAFGEEERG